MTSAEHQQVDIDLLREIQFRIALEIKRICEAYGISYFLVDGSALDVYYLHRFLPWEDDLDIGMYWKDYQRFLETCKGEIRLPYQIADYMDKLQAIAF